MKTSISVQYKTTDGTLWETYEQALIAEVLESTPSLYLESYKLRSIVEALDKNLYIGDIGEDDPEEIERKNNLYKSAIDNGENIQ